MKFEETCFACAPRKECCLKGQVFVVWIDLPAIETCILVEIDLQVYIFARKVGLTGPKVYFHILLFARWDAQVTWGRGDSHGDANFASFS